MADVPHFAFPFHRGPSGQVVEVDQDSADDVAARVVVLLSYPLGFLDRLPTFGVVEQLFDRVNLNELRAALAEWDLDVGLLADEDLERFITYVQAQVQSSEV